MIKCYIQFSADDLFFLLEISFCRSTKASFGFRYVIDAYNLNSQYLRLKVLEDQHRAHLPTELGVIDNKLIHLQKQLDPALAKNVFLGNLSCGAPSIPQGHQQIMLVLPIVLLADHIPGRIAQ